MTQVVTLVGKVVLDERTDLAQRSRQPIELRHDEGVGATAPEYLQCLLQPWAVQRAAEDSLILFYVDKPNPMKLAIGSQPIALCVQTHPIGGLLLCTYADISDGRLGVVCMLVSAHAARNDSRSWTPKSVQSFR